jgi:DNA-binding transcriptional ArsR family regulator
MNHMVYENGIPGAAEKSALLRAEHGVAQSAGEREQVPLHPMPSQNKPRLARGQGRSRKSEAHKVYELQARICKALAHPTRMHIMDLLGRRPYTVSGLQRELGIPLPNVSIQIAILRSAGIVETHKEGKKVYCSLAFPEIKQACHLVHCVLRAQVRSTQKLPI